MIDRRSILTGSAGLALAAAATAGTPAAAAAPKGKGAMPSGGTLPPPGTPIRDQMRAARMGLYRTPYERFERAVRSQSAAALGAGGFDPARDILAITTNRWGHGYALPNNVLFDDPNAPPTYVVGRQKFGRIAIANSDSSGVDTIETAFNEAARAVRELEPHVSGRYGVI